jgi:uncharacterized membrane protein YeaQ/YmgE (transglycosylase-associated protein family)
VSLDNVDLEAIVIWLVVGIAAGWLARQIMRSKRGLISYALLGIVGAIVGGFLFSTLDLGGATDILGQIVIATIGAVLVLAVVGK